MRPDVVVVGAGLSGLTSAVRLAESGAKVLVLATGSGAISLAPATIDVMGYADGRRVADPVAAAKKVADDHPYAAIGAGEIKSALAWLRDAVARGPLETYEYTGRGDIKNLLLATALGAVKPSALAPASIAAGDVRDVGGVLVAGVEAMKDFHPALIAANLNRAGFGIVARAATVRRPRQLALEPTTTNLARFLDDLDNARALGAELRELVREDEAIALPAIVGLKRPGAVRAALERETRRSVFEIPTLPPSVPGMRLLDVMRTLLRQAGGQIIMHARVTGYNRRAGAITELKAHVSGRERLYAAPHFVLATGGLTSGAIALGSDWVTRETALGLDVACAPRKGGRRFSPEYFDSHPLSTAGIAVDDQLRPKRAALENLRVVGATLAGAEAWREKSGDGISLASGYKAAGLIAGSKPAAKEKAAA